MVSSQRFGIIVNIPSLKTFGSSSVLDQHTHDMKDLLEQSLFIIIYQCFDDNKQNKFCMNEINFV